MLNINADSTTRAPASSKPSPLGNAIHELLKVLAEIRRHDQGFKTPTEGRQTVWEDEDYHYIESRIADSEISFCDVNITEGKVFVRIVRENEVDNPIEYLPRLAAIAPIEVPLEA